MTRAFKLKADYMEFMSSIPRTVCPQITSESTKQLGDPPSESAKPATPSVLGGPNEESVDQEPAKIVDDNAVSNDATETNNLFLKLGPKGPARTKFNIPVSTTFVSLGPFWANLLTFKFF